MENTPREKEGGKLFIKYLLGVESIGHINLEQAKNLLELKNWKNIDKIKSIFKDQKENDNFTTKKNCFPNTISFYSISHKRKKKLINIHFKK